MIKKILSPIKRIYKKISRPVILKKVDTIGEKQPRTSKIPNIEDPKIIKGSDSEIFRKLSELSEEIFADFKQTDKVLIKININTSDPYPASTDPIMLCELIKLLKARGISDITVGDCSAYYKLPSRKVFRNSQLYKAIESNTKLSFFDEEKWYKVQTNGNYLTHVTLPESVYSADKIIYLANLKTHKLADFSLGMKLAVGFMHPKERIYLHKEFLHEKIAELMLAIQPDLIFIDGRKCFITGGPSIGQIANGNVVIVGNSVLNTDLQAYNILYNIKETNNCLDQFKKDPFEMKQFKHAQKDRKKDVIG